MTVRRRASAARPGRLNFWNPAIAKNSAGLKDVAEVFKADGLFDIVAAYCGANPGVTQNDLFKTLEKLRGIRIGCLVRTTTSCTA